MLAHPPGLLVLSRAHGAVAEAWGDARTAALQQDRERSWEREEGQELLRELFGCPLLLDHFHLSEQACPHSIRQLNPPVLAAQHYCPHIPCPNQGEGPTHPTLFFCLGFFFFG